MHSDGRDSVVYFRQWHRRECAEFENGTLRQQAVLESLRGLNCVKLELDWSADKAREWNVDASPSVVFVQRDGTVFDVLQPENLRNAFELVGVARQFRQAISPANAGTGP